jgi:hypothetical protein
VVEERFSADRESLGRWAESWRGRFEAVAIEATTGWRWVWRELVAMGFEVRLAEPVQARGLLGRRAAFTAPKENRARGVAPHVAACFTSRARESSDCVVKLAAGATIVNMDDGVFIDTWHEIEADYFRTRRELEGVDPEVTRTAMETFFRALKGLAEGREFAHWRLIVSDKFVWLLVVDTTAKAYLVRLDGDEAEVRFLGVLDGGEYVERRAERDNFEEMVIRFEHARLPGPIEIGSAGREIESLSGLRQTFAAWATNTRVKD